MTEEQHKEITDRLDCIIALMSRKELQDLNKTESIHLLHSLGVPNDVISKATRTSKSAVAVRISERRAKLK